MKISEVLQPLEATMDSIQFTRVVDTQEDIETPVNQYRVVNIIQNPSMGYKKWNFDVIMAFESFEQYELLFEDSGFYQELIHCYQCSSFEFDDKKLILSFKSEIIW